MRGNLKWQDQQPTRQTRKVGRRARDRRTLQPAGFVGAVSFGAIEHTNRNRGEERQWGMARESVCGWVGVGVMDEAIFISSCVLRSSVKLCF